MIESSIGSSSPDILYLFQIFWTFLDPYDFSSAESGPLIKLVEYPWSMVTLKKNFWFCFWFRTCPKNNHWFVQKTISCLLFIFCINFLDWWCFLNFWRLKCVILLKELYPPKLTNPISVSDRRASYNCYNLSIFWSKLRLRFDCFVSTMHGRVVNGPTSLGPNLARTWKLIWSSNYPRKKRKLSYIWRI